MATQWMRWNETTHIFEYSVDGVSFNPLPLNALAINEGTMDPSRLPGGGVSLSANNIFTGVNRYSHAAPTLQFNETDQAVGSKNWDISVDGGLFSLRQLDDAYASPVLAMQIARGGNIYSPNGFDVGASLQTTAKFRTRQAGNALEFGHPNAAGFASALGAMAGSGIPFLAFNSEHGTSSNTFRTRGIPGSVFRGDNAGGFNWSKIPSANADNQTEAILMSLSNAGVLNLQLEGILERGRSTKMGEWISIPYSAGNFLASAGTWTVDSADQSTLRYMLVGKTCILQVFLQTTSVSTTPNYLQITLPAAITSAGIYGGVYALGDNNVVPSLGYWRITAGSSILTLGKQFNLAGTFAVAANTTYVVANIAYEIQ